MYGQGGLYRRPRSRFWWYRFSINGGDYRGSTRTSDRKIALEVLRDKMAAAGCGPRETLPAPYRDMRALLVEVVRDYRIRGLASLDECQRTCDVLTRAIGHFRAHMVDEDMVRKLVEDWQRDGQSNASCNRRLAKLGRAFRLARIIPPRFPKLAETNVRSGFLSPHEVASQLRALRDPDLQDVVEWYGWTGMRPGEISRLEWTWYDGTDHCLYVGGRAAKNRKGRVIPCVGPLAAIIAKRAIVRDGAYIFHRRGKPLGRFYKAWYSALARAGLPRFIPHDLRRTAVRNLRRAGVDEKTAMLISGHRTPSTFKRYNIVNTEDLAQALTRVHSYVTNVPSPEDTA